MTAPKPAELFVGDPPPRNHAELRDRLLRLYEQGGRPSYKEMDAAARTVGVALAKATLSDLRNDKYRDRRSGWDVVKGVVAGCLLCSGESKETVAVELDRWRSWWSHVSIESGEVVTKTARPSAAEPPMTMAPSEAAPLAPGRRRQRWLARRWLVPVVCVACFGAGFGAGTIDWSKGTDPSLAYGPCGEALGKNIQHGSTVLLAEGGPPGKPVPDRRIELRTQQNPDYGWIAWSHLETSTSDLDRLWLDWSYFPAPNDPSAYRQCGAQPISAGRDTPALLVSDASGRDRWFRACGQAPYKDRAPDYSGTFCTSWTRPRI